MCVCGTRGNQLNNLFDEVPHSAHDALVVPGVSFFVCNDTFVNAHDRESNYLVE